MLVGSSCAEADAPARAAVAASSKDMRRRFMACDTPLLIDAAADCRLLEPFAIHLLRLDLLGDWVHELIGLPKARVLLGEIDSLFDEGFAVRIRVVDLVGAD